MKVMHKILLSLAVLSAVVPSGMQANALTRVMNRQNLLAVVKNPGVVMGIIGGASLIAAEELQNKAGEIYPSRYSKAEWKKMRHVRMRYETAALTGKLLGAGLIGMSLNYALFSLLRRQGYLAQLSDLCKKDPTYKRALVAAPLFSMFMGKKILHDNQHSTGGIILLVEPLMAAITYALWFSKG